MTRGWRRLKCRYKEIPARSCDRLGSIARTSDGSDANRSLGLHKAAKNCERESNLTFSMVSVSSIINLNDATFPHALFKVKLKIAQARRLVTGERGSEFRIAFLHRLDLPLEILTLQWAA